MKKFLRSLAIVVLVFSATSGAFATPVCAKYFNRRDNLLAIEQPTLRTALKHNRQVIDELNRLPLPAKRSNFKMWINFEEATELHNYVANHPVVGVCALSKYDPTNEYGFCFGRSEAYAARAKKIGVHTKSIKKIFAIGWFNKIGHPYAQSWQYHVITLVRSADQKWYAFDPILFDRPVTLEKWYSEMRSLSKYRAMNLFVTNTQRVFPTSTKRDLMNPGYGEEVTQYFQDYFKSLKEE